jgi:hypothetical protein
MTQRPHLFWTLCLAAVLLSACGPKPSTPDPNLVIRQAVAATLNALPTAAPLPTVPTRPSPTPMTLNGLFCEYNFCIGHPADMAFFDVSAQQNPATPSGYSHGLLAAFNPSLFIQLIWQYAPGSSDPQIVMDLSLENGIDTPRGGYELKLINGINVLLNPIQSTASPLLPYGLVAGWVCGDRVFAWKIYTPQDGMADGLLQDTLNRFRCE